MRIVTGPGYRISLLTTRLVRLEWSETDEFVDDPTQLVISREFATPEHREVRTSKGIEIITEHLHLRYDEKPFSPGGLSIQLLGNVSNYHSLWRFEDPYEDLRGTARTLDGIDGALPLEPGILSRNGFTVVDDSDSLLVTADGWVEPRRSPATDLYFFGYGREYHDCLVDFHRLTGPVPLLPRYTLGNWWSRYHPYSADEYRALMDRFDAETIPFSVAVIDMDWHLVDIDPQLGSGWTGFTWNPELFPDPAAFLAGLHRRGLAVTLNLHPADGIRRHESAYAAIARRLGVDERTGDPVSFDVTDRAFMDAYFEEVLHPLEVEGVDFWWLDWQQGGVSAIPGLDPLWMLNHLHYRDSARGERRPLTFSRYAGLGSHRNPIGFSGDAAITWKSLEFQPAFTATASNVGYGWWSHDIGGHILGYRDDELTTRWVQLGVFSPINRLHSTNNPFIHKEPWQVEHPFGAVMAESLRLRHRLVPYLYSMVHRASRESRPMVEPLYHRHPDVPMAYEHANQFFFGTQMLVAPITSPIDPQSRLGSTEAWLPPGMWCDIFTGLRYDGNREIRLHRGIESIPVLAPVGAVIPEQALSSHADTNPDEVRFVVIAGAHGSFDLHEDDGSGSSPATTRVATTRVDCVWPTQIRIHPVTGEAGVIPSRRTYVLELRGVLPPGDIVVEPATQDVAYDVTTRTLVVVCRDVPVSQGMVVRASDGLQLAPNDVMRSVHAILDRAWIEFDTKTAVMERIRDLSPAAAAGQVLTMAGGVRLPQPVADALVEVLLAG